MRKLVVALAVLACAAPVWAADEEGERKIPYFWPHFDFAKDRRVFEYEMAVTAAGGKETSGTLAITTESNAVTLSLTMSGKTESGRVRFDGEDGGPTGVSSWLRMNAPPPGPTRAYWDLMWISKVFAQTAARSEWEDGFIDAVPGGELVVTTTECTVGSRAGRKMYVTGNGSVEGCFSPDVPYPLEAVDRRAKDTTVRYTLKRYEGPPAPRSGYAWHCDKDCGPPPRRPPAIGSPAPAFTAARWAGAKGPVTVDASKEKVLVVHACRLQSPICVSTAKEMNALATAHPEDLLVVTLVAAGDKDPTDAIRKETGVTHVLGVQTWTERDALEKAYDLDKFPIAWVIKDGKVAWYGTRLRSTKWIQGNAYNEKSRDEADAKALVRAVESALR